MDPFFTGSLVLFVLVMAVILWNAYRALRDGR